MGKKQHSKDRLYLTTKEWKHEWGGYKDKVSVSFKRLPFHCCAISFTPFEEPVCTEDGTTFETSNVVPYVLKYKKHPVTGNPLTLKDLYKLNFYKNKDGEFHCPVLNKVFTEHTHIVAIKTTGNVYCFEAVDELNIKPKNWKDLLTDETFTRKDIIHIQDPLNISGRTIDQFDHVKCNLSANDEDEAANDNLTREQLAEKLASKRAEAELLLLAAKRKAGQTLPPGPNGRATDGATPSVTKSSTLSSKHPVPSSAPSKNSNEEDDWRLRAPARSSDLPSFKPGTATWDTDDHSTPASKKKNDSSSSSSTAVSSSSGPAQGAARKPTPQERYEAAGHVRYEESATSTGAMSRGFTSTAMAISSKNTRERRRVDRNPTKKGYVRLHTTLGDLNVELHCDIVPRTCENFIALCEMGYYDGVPFHRLIRNFMVQGGDPTGSGKGGESIYGQKFRDELDSRLVHAGRGVLSMANSGPNTNGSQFFITFKSCRHLDFKHSVFGKVVGGLEVLDRMERIVTDDEDCPLQEIKITGTSVFANPYQEMEDEEKRAAEAAERRKRLGLDPSDPRGDDTGLYEGPGADVLLPGLFHHGPPPVDEPGGPSVGKYLQQRLRQQQSQQPQSHEAQQRAIGPGATAQRKTAAAAAAEEDAPAVKKTKLAPKSTFSDFSGW